MESGKGTQCKLCNLAVETMQRRCKLEWKDEYKVKYSALKANKQGWKQSVLDVRKSCPSLGRGKKRVLQEVSQLTHRHIKGNKTRRARTKQWMTWPVFLEWMQKPEGGEHTFGQATDQWETFRVTGVKSNNRGTVKGRSGQLQYLVRKREDEIS